MRIPGTETSRSIDFPTALKIAPKEAHIQRDYSEMIKGGGVDSDKWVVVNSDAKTATAKLENPEVLMSAASPPVSLEAVVLYNKSGTQAKISKFRPNSVAAWRYLSTALTQSPDLLRVADKAAEAVEIAVRDYLAKPTVEQQTKIVECYREFETSISALGAKIDDETTARALGSLSNGISAEKGAWQQTTTIESPGADGKTKSNEPRDGSLNITKAGSSKVMRYKGQDDSQRWHGIAMSKAEYRAGRACVGIVDLGSEEDAEEVSKSAFASGSMIGQGLILTCAHDVTEVAENKLAIRFGPDKPEDLETPGFTIPAKLIYSGRRPKNSTDETLDFCLIQLKPKPEQAEALRRANIKQISLTTALPEFTNKFFLAGYPNDRARVISPNAYVCYPHIIDVSTREALLTQLRSRQYLGITPDQMITIFNDSYHPHGSGVNMTYKYVLNSPGDKLNHLPLIGAICSTIGGQSGGPACVLQNGDQFGVFLGGTDPERELPPVEPGWLTHEKILPITSVIEHLDKNLMFDEGGRSVSWRQKYNVSVLTN